MPTLNLAEMAEGAFMEQFTRELNKVLENIADPNTDAKKTRKVVLTATVKADEERDIAIFEVQCKSTLVPVNAQSTKIIIDRDNHGNIVGAELRSGQKGQLFIDTDSKVKDDTGSEIESRNNVVNFTSK